MHNDIYQQIKLKETKNCTWNIVKNHSLLNSLYTHIFTALISKDYEIPVRYALVLRYSMHVVQVHLHIPNALHASVAVGARHPRRHTAITRLMVEQVRFAGKVLVAIVAVVANNHPPWFSRVSQALRRTWNTNFHWLERIKNTIALKFWKLLLLLYLVTINNKTLLFFHFIAIKLKTKYSIGIHRNCSSFIIKTL